MLNDSGVFGLEIRQSSHPSGNSPRAGRDGTETRHRLRMTRLIFAAVAAAFIFHAPVRAGTIVNYADNVGDNLTTPAVCGTQNGLGSFGVAFSASCSFIESGSTFSGMTEAEAPTLGVAEVSATLSASGGTGPAFSAPVADATAWSLDTWTNTANIPVILSYTVSVDVPPGVSTPITLSPYAPGNTEGVSALVSALCIQGNGADAGAPGGGPYGNGILTPSVTCSATIPAFSTFEMGVGIQAAVSANFGSSTSYHPFSATVDYWGTGQLTAVTVTDSSNDPLSASLLESSNGTFLTATGYAPTSVPEPSSLILASLGLLSAMLIALRRKASPIER